MKPPVASCPRHGALLEEFVASGFCALGNCWEGVQPLNVVVGQTPTRSTLPLVQRAPQGWTFTRDGSAGACRSQ